MLLHIQPMRGLDRGVALTLTCHVVIRSRYDTFSPQLESKIMQLIKSKIPIHRPALTNQDVLDCLSALQEKKPTASVTKKFILLQYKIENGIASVSYEKKESDAAALEMVAAIPASGNPLKCSPEQKLSIYQFWKQSPEQCTVFQLTVSNLYRYENNLMSPEEETIFEKTL